MIELADEQIHQEFGLLNIGNDNVDAVGTLRQAVLNEQKGSFLIASQLYHLAASQIILMEGSQNHDIADKINDKAMALCSSNMNAETEKNDSRSLLRSITALKDTLRK